MITVVGADRRAVLFPKSVYAYLAVAAGIIHLLNWLNILASDLKNRSAYKNRMAYALPDGYLGSWYLS